MPMTGNEMIKLLKKHGWSIVRINGSHHVMAKKGEPKKVVVPVHGNKTLATGTEHDILRQARLK